MRPSPLCISGTLLSLSEARYLAAKGLLVEQDVLGTTHSQIADGSIVDNNIKNKILIDNKITTANLIKKDDLSQIDLNNKYKSINKVEL